MLLFDVGANRGDAVLAGLQKGFDRIIAIEPAPRIFSELVRNFLYVNAVTPLKYAVSDSDFQTIKFYEAEEDGLSTMNLDWLTSETMPYAGKPYRTVEATTIKIDTLVKNYGTPDLIKIDVEGAEWSVFKGMSYPWAPLTFEWTMATITEHVEQMKYLEKLGYKEYALQFIEHHLQEPDENMWLPIAKAASLKNEISAKAIAWEAGGWKNSGLRPTADVGMLWVR